MLFVLPRCPLLKWELILLSALVKLTMQSIAGVTYMNHFDFEERYRNVYECDPFNWYPLHLPEHCMTMFEELIRKGVAAFSPIQIIKDREYEDDSSGDENPFYETVLLKTRRKTPYEKMFDMLRNDVQKEPSAPQISYVPGLGLAALYKQPISRKSGQYIKKVAGVYRDSNSDLRRYYEVTTTTTDNPNVEDSKENEKNSKILKMKSGRTLRIFKS